MFVLRPSRLALKVASQSSRRFLHTTCVCRKNEDASSKQADSVPENKGPDTLEHLYKKKYEFIHKQKLEESYNRLHKDKPGHEEFREGEQRSQGSSSSDEKTFQLTQRLKLMAAGLVALALTVGGLQAYQNRVFIKAKLFGEEGLETFDEMYERIKSKKQKKLDALETFATTVTNPNDSSVPGVYICGNNKHHLVVDEDSYDYIPVFKRLDVFDNVIVKDIAIGEKSGALIDQHGDLYQWGTGFGGDSKKPTIKGKRLEKVQISNDAVYTLTKQGEVLYLPENVELQKEVNANEKGWFGSYSVSYLKLKTPKKNIKDIVAGSQHLVLLDKDGHVYTTATGFNKKITQSFGQFGLPEFSQFDEPPKINEVHDVVLLNKYMKNGQVLHRDIIEIAAGDYFTLCLDKSGAVWAFGKNTHGAIGTMINYDTEIIPYPTQVQFIATHFKRNEFPRCTNIEAGGDTAYASFSSSNIYELFEKSLKSDGSIIDNSFTFDSLPEAEQNNLHLSWGHGLKGELGLGYFVHGTYEPKKIKVLNDVKEFNEMTNKLEKIKVKAWTVGRNHSIVTLENNDVYVWGDNEYGQLGNGKRIRAGAPSTIPLLLEPENNKKMKFAKFNNRLQLLDNGKFHQEIVAGRDTTAIVYKKD
ncbi:hypothetical protein PMKS-001242 [Pichia membranifaciens]|uniref:Mitochondrial protein n=1 Tax=Pichia membranifaciens TaxID=4926 RepID=A0A1Q2YE25_9ASCO|nr:hypothetical protein PMKS-001242 [Pichia membranifaciens]